MTLTFDLQGHGHIMCHLVDLVDYVYLSKPVPCGQYFERCGDSNAFVE